MLPLIIGFTLLGSIGALLGAALLLAFPAAVHQRLLPLLVSLAAGTLLGSAFLCLLPAGLAWTPAIDFMAMVMVGFVCFFALERLVLARHSAVHEGTGGSVAAPLILIGDGFHNFVDGVVIAAAFATSISRGITTALAVLAHEIPQEIGEFAILLESGYSRRRALFLNGLSASAAVPGAILAHMWLQKTQSLVPAMLALSAASFLYVASVDLIPSLGSDGGWRGGLRQLLLLLAGIGIIAAVAGR